MKTEENIAILTVGPAPVKKSGVMQPVSGCGGSERSLASCGVFFWGEVDVSYTKGPWVERAYLIETESGRKVCLINAEHARYGEPARSSLILEDDANARLIAAAPELLEACKESILQLEYLDAKYHGTSTTAAVLVRVEAAIKKAEGAI